MLHLHPAIRSQPHLRDIFRWPDKVSYLAWRVGLLGRRERAFSLMTGGKVILRLLQADIWTATEVFLLKEYLPPAEIGDVREVVDLGANVGYATLYLAQRFSAAHIDAFEPHPVHLRQLRANISANALGERVTIHPCAAGRRQEMLFLSDTATESKVVRNRAPTAIPVHVIDWLDFATHRKIDLLKMDIEGGEYDILFDARFATLSIPNIVLEWHATRERPEAESEICNRLVSLGYTVHESRAAKEIPGLRFGIFWALRGGKRS